MANEMTKIKTPGKTAINSKGFVGSSFASLLSAIALIYIEFNSTGKIPPQEAALLIGAVLSGVIGAYGRFTASTRIKRLF